MQAASLLIAGPFFDYVMTQKNVLEYSFTTLSVVCTWHETSELLHSCQNSAFECDAGVLPGRSSIVDIEGLDFVIAARHEAGVQFS